MTGLQHRQSKGLSKVLAFSYKKSVTGPFMTEATAKIFNGVGSTRNLIGTKCSFYRLVLCFTTSSVHVDQGDCSSCSQHSKTCTEVAYLGRHFGARGTSVLKIFKQTSDSHLYIENGFSRRQFLNSQIKVK